LSLATASPALDLEAIRATLKQQPDGVLDDVARGHAVPLRVVLDLLPGPAAKSAPGARFAEIWGDLVDWGQVTFIVHAEDGVFETKAPLPPGSEARGFYHSRGEPAWRPPAHCAMRGDLFYRSSILRTPVLLAAIHQHRWRRHVQGLCRAR
jgi:putative heme iron utilization protein